MSVIPDQAARAQFQQRLRSHRSRRASATAAGGASVADAITATMGSWRFIGLQTLTIATWCALNVVALVHHWDPYPFILLNLLFSTQAAYASPLILMSQNRAAAREGKRDDVTAAEVAELYIMARQQVEMTRLMHQILTRLEEQAATHRPKM